MAIKGVREYIKNDRIYVDTTSKTIGDRTVYDFMICRVDDGKPLIWAPFIYDSEEGALDAGKQFVHNIYHQGLEEIVV